MALGRGEVDEPPVGDEVEAPPVGERELLHELPRAPRLDRPDQLIFDFDPDDGLYSGSAVNGSSEIPGPHEDQDTGELTGMDEAEQPSSEGEAERQQAPDAGKAKPQEAPEASG